MVGLRLLGILSHWFSLNSHVNLLSCFLLLHEILRILQYLLALVDNVLDCLSIRGAIRLHHVLDLLLGYLQKLLGLDGSLDLGHGVCVAWHLRATSLDLLGILGVGCVQKHSHSGESHQDVLDILVVLVLSHELRSQLKLLL